MLDITLCFTRLRLIELDQASLPQFSAKAPTQAKTRRQADKQHGSITKRDREVRCDLTKKGLFSRLSSSARRLRFKKGATFNCSKRIVSRFASYMEVIAVTEARLTRSNTDKILAGVCGGLAAYLGIDSVLVRLAFLVLLFASGIGLPIYFIMWIVMPSEENVGVPNSEVIQKNIEEMGSTVSSSVNRFGRPGTVGILLILFGVYFLLSQFGWLHWLSGDVFWPLLIIGVGLFLLFRRR